MDLHGIKGCPYEPFATTFPLPFFLPARAFSNNLISNLIVVGRAMAQDFDTSMATRTHSTELSSGVAGIFMATFMKGEKISTTWDFLECPSCI